MRYAVIDSPLGFLTLASTEKGLASVHFGADVPANGIIDESANREVIQQLQEYFDGNRVRFELSLDVQGTLFQMAVWDELRKIPYGATCSYGEIARALGKPGAARAVGMANHENPIAVVVPCHRVIGTDGSLTGYAGGLWRKKWLLDHENPTAQQSLF